MSDPELRAAAVSHVAALANRYGVLTWAQIDQGFEFRGERVRLAGRARGIFKPRQLGDGALSVRTPQPREGRAARYDDQIASDRPWFEYRWMGDDPQNDANRSLRACLERRLPVIYFYAIDEAVYEPIICNVAGEDAAGRSFHLAPVARGQIEAVPALRAAALPIERRYGIAEVRRRLHQQKFRAAVIAAYDVRCAICRLRHPELLDAAHIEPDGDVLGEARVPNGLSLCKLHHAAFDNFLLGVTPELEVRIHRDLLDERDGPMLEHGLRAFHGRPLILPRDAGDQPDRVLLERRWKKFAA